MRICACLVLSVVFLVGDVIEANAAPVRVAGPLSWLAPKGNGRTLRRRFRVEVEAGPVFQTRNDVAIPGDTGTRFALDDLSGSGPFPYGRITLDWNICGRHNLRALVAPLQFSGTEPLKSDVSFQGTTFTAGADTKATFRFNSYRLGYRYRWIDTPKWTVHVGATIKVRDAKIEMSQAGVRRRKTDLGFVPLLHVDAKWRFARRWSLVADLDGLAAPQGRAFDFALKAYYQLNDSMSLGFGYRTIEGGADNDSVYTFSWFHQAVVSVSFRF